MNGVAAGSEDAVWQLAETYTPYIIRAVRDLLPKTVRLRLDSQDFAQILWASLLLGGTDLTRLETPEQLIKFLATAARNRVRDATRHYLYTQKMNITRELRLDDVRVKERGHRRSANKSGEPMSRDPSPSQYAMLRERWARVMADASDRDQKILRMRLSGASFEKISHDLKIDPSTAQRAIQRFIEKLSE